MWTKEASKKIADILTIIAESPNLRPHPEDSFGNVMIFDGGEVIYHTGITCFKFSDGTAAIFGTSIDLGLTIDFPSGETVVIRHERI